MLRIIAGLEQELSGLRKELQAARKETEPHVELRVVGPGAPQARSDFQSPSARPAAASQPPDDTGEAWLLLGFAGGIDPELKTGDLVVASRYYLARPSADFMSADASMLELAKAAAGDCGIPAAHAYSLTVDAMICTPRDKAECGRRFPAATVNMEDYWLAAQAKAAGVPFLSVRAVLDEAGRNLPPYLLGMSQARPLDVLRTAAMPWRTPTLLKLAHQARQARGPLTKFAISFIDLFNRHAFDGSLLHSASLTAAGASRKE